MPVRKERVGRKGTKAPVEEKKESASKVNSRTKQSKAAKGSSSVERQPAKPCSSASSAPIRDKAQQPKKNVNSRKKRLSKSMNSPSPQPEAKKMVKPRTKSEERVEKRRKGTKPPVEETAEKKKKGTKPPVEERAEKKKKGTKPPVETENLNPRAAVPLFDDNSSEDDGDLAEQFGGITANERVFLGKMTPNALLKSVEADALDFGRHTPPMQRIQHLFESGSKSLASTGGSPSSLNTSRDNPVAKRMNKHLEEMHKKPKKVVKKPLTASNVENRDPKMGEAFKFLTSSQKNLTTPKIVKQVFRNQADDGTDDEDEELDQSLTY